jgi:hypothetical protein
MIEGAVAAQKVMKLKQSYYPIEPEKYHLRGHTI